jgi:hypothetical protein
MFGIGFGVGLLAAGIIVAGTAGEAGYTGAFVMSAAAATAVVTLAHSRRVVRDAP